MKNISILGSTGSIGTQTIEVCRNLKDINIQAITVNSNIDMAQKQAEEFRPKLIAVMNSDKAEELKERLSPIFFFSFIRTRIKSSVNMLTSDFTTGTLR